MITLRSAGLTLGLLVLLSSSASPSVRAQNSEEYAGPNISWVAGPFRASLGHDLAAVDVPEGYLFCDGDDTRLLMEYMGNPTDGTEVGTILPASEEEGWLLVFEFLDAGYVKDDDKDQIDAAKLLSQIKQGNEAANEYRRDHGVAPIEITGWQTEPYYDESSQNLVWSVLAVSEQHPIANHNTRILGRRGFMSVTIVADPGETAAIVSEIEPIMGSFAYEEGNRYFEFQEGDRLAEYGLAALVAGGAGVAAAKLGFFAVLAKFFGKIWKLLILGIAALGGMIRRLFGRRETASSPVIPPPPPSQT